MTQLALQTRQQYGEKSETLFREGGQEAQYLEKQFAKVYVHFTYPILMQSDLHISMQSDNLSNLHKFCNLAETWKEETKLSSSITDIASNPSYIGIIAMGERVIPFILQDLMISKEHWFPALRALTGVSPIKRAHIGNVEEMTKDWLDWAKENGYI